MNAPFKRYLALLKSPKVTISGLLLAYFIYMYLTANPSGFCEEQKRVIPDEEICAKLFDEHIKRGHLQLGPSENSGLDYYMNHPNYCSVGKSTMGRFRREGLLYALLYNDMQVFLAFKMTDAGKKYWKSYGAESHSLWEAPMLLTPCGKITQAHVETTD